MFNRQKREDVSVGVESPIARPGVITGWRVIPYAWLLAGALLIGTVVLILMLLPPPKVDLAQTADSLPFQGDCPGSSDDDGSISSWLWTGDQARDFTAERLDGSSLTLGDYLGKQPLWLSFWNVLCEQCTQNVGGMQTLYEAKHPLAGVLQTLYEKYHPLGVEFITISFSHAETTRDLLREKNYPWPVGLDPTRNLARIYCVDRAPAHLFIDKEGTIRRILIGGVESEQMPKSLDKLLHR